MKPPATTSEPTRRPSLLGLTGRLHGGPDLPVGLLEVGAHLLVLHVRGVPLVLLGGLLPLLRLDHLLDRVLPVRHRLLRHVGRAVETAPVVERDVVAFLWRRRHVVERRFQALVPEDREAAQVPGLELAAELAHPGHRGGYVAVQERGGLLPASLVGDEVDLLWVAAGRIHQQREWQPVVAGGAYRHLAGVLLHGVQKVLEVLVLGVGGDGHHVVLGDEAHDHGDVRVLVVGVATQVVGHYGCRGDGYYVVFTLVIVNHLRQPARRTTDSALQNVHPSFHYSFLSPKVISLRGSSLVVLGRPLLQNLRPRCFVQVARLARARDGALERVADDL